MDGSGMDVGTAPLVTLCLKGFNQEDTIEAAIEAAFAQTYGPLEILMSDDGSTDTTYEIMSRMAEAYRGPHHVTLNRNPVNLGIVGNMNRVAALAAGRLLVEASGDDLSEPQRVARLAEAWLAGRGRIKALHSGFLEIDDAGREIGLGGPERSVVDAPGPDPLTIIRSGANCIGATAAWDRELFDRFGPIPDNCHVEDGVLFFRAALLDGIAFIDEPLVRYRTGGVSRRRPRSPGYDYLYGDRIKFARWRMNNVHAFLTDLEEVEIPRKDACVAFCREYAERSAFELGLVEQGPLARLAALPGAVGRSAVSGDGFFARQSFKHALGYGYVAYRNVRAAMTGASPGRAGRSIPSATRSGSRSAAAEVAESQ